MTIVISVADKDFLVLHSSPDHQDLKVILDLANYPDDHDGKIVFIKEIKGQAIPPFVNASRFYFNDGGEWYTMDERGW